LTGSLTELTAIVGKNTTVAEINAAMKAAANESFGYTEDEIVSSDIIGISYGSLFDATQTKVSAVGDTQLVRVVSWYDNEMSYVSQLVRTVKYFAGLIK
jgi:glyceraldehyde 3-phosphate dehydrogenase